MAELLRTNYVDDILDTSKNTLRKYNMITNSDGTVSFEDVTEYKQVGDSFGSAIVNAQNTDLANIKEDISELNSNKFDKSGGTTTGNISVNNKLLLKADSEGGNIRITSPNSHHWEIDAIGNSFMRIYHGTSDTEVDNTFYFNAEDGRISSDDGKIAFVAEVEDAKTWLPNSSSTTSQTNIGVVKDGFCTNARLVDFSNPWSMWHKPMNVRNDITIALPSDCSHGIREVFYMDQNNIISTIKGWDTGNIGGYWIAFCYKYNWEEWKRII